MAHLASIVLARVAVVVDADVVEPLGRVPDRAAVELLKPNPAVSTTLSFPELVETHLLRFIP